jgi:hypothetical protein
VGDLICEFVLKGICGFAEAEVAELYVSFRVDENVIGFEIAMDIVFAMYVFDGEDLSIKSCTISAA